MKTSKNYTWVFRDTHLFICVVSIFYVIMSIFGRLFAYAKTGLRLQSFSRYCIIGGRFFRSRSKTAAYLKTNGKKDIRLRPCRTSKMYIHVHFWLRVFCGTKNSAVLTGCQWFHAVSSYVNLQHPCCKLTCEFCKSKTSFLPNTPAIRGGSEQNSKQPNVHGCIFGCDSIRAASELTSLSMLGHEFACCKLTALTGGP